MGYENNCIDKDPADNTKYCYVDHARSSKANHVAGGFSIYGDPVTGKENIEGSVHCHGFAWPDYDPLHRDNILKGNLLFFVSMYDHMTQRGYVRNIPGSPMCACAENMAVVTRADCTQTDTTENTTFQWTVSTSSIVAVPKITDVNFNACTGKNANNNLEERVRKLNDDGLLGPIRLRPFRSSWWGAMPASAIRRSKVFWPLRILAGVALLLHRRYKDEERDRMGVW